MNVLAVAPFELKNIAHNGSVFARFDRNLLQTIDKVMANLVKHNVTGCKFGGLLKRNIN